MKKRVCDSNCRDPENRNKWKKCCCGFHSAKARRGKAKYKNHRGK